MMLVNPQQIKALRSRKSDAGHSQRIAKFRQDWPLNASFVSPGDPPVATMTRHRVALLEPRKQVHNQILDLLSWVASDIMGVPGQYAEGPWRREKNRATRLSYESVTRQIGEMETALADRTQPYPDQSALLRTIPGIEKNHGVEPRQAWYNSGHT